MSKEKPPHAVDLIERTTKRKWWGQRRGEILYLESFDGRRVDSFTVWSHNPVLAKKHRESFRRKYYNTEEHGWPWEADPPIKNLLAPEGDELYAAPYLPDSIEEVEVIPDPPGNVSIVLEFHGFAEYPLCHVFNDFGEAWDFVKKHPATLIMLNKAKSDPDKINYFEYEDLADKLATRTTTVFKIHNMIVK